MITPEPLNQNKNKAPLSALNPAFFIFLALTVVFIAYQFIGGAIILAVYGVDFSPENIKGNDINIVRVIMSFSQFMFILFPALILNLLKGDRVKQAFSLNKAKLPVLLLSAGGIILVQPLLQVYVFFQNKALFALPFSQDVIKPLKDVFDNLESATNFLVSAHSVPEFLLVAFVIAVTPAVCEEFLFRGLIFSNFKKIITPSKAIFFTGLIFALFHFHPFNLVPLCILGCFLTYITYYSGSIYPAVICHFLNNFLAAGAYFLYGADEFNDKGLQGSEMLMYAGAGIVSAAVFILILKLIKKTSAKDKEILIQPSETL